MSRILQITTLPVTSQVFILPLANRLARQGHSVELAYGGPVYQAFPSYPAHHIALTRNPLHPLNGRGLAQLVNLIHRQQYDVVHTHTPVAGLVGRLAAYLAGVPLVLYTLHGSFWETRPRWREILFDQMERLAAGWTSHVFAFNDADINDLQRRCKFAPEQVSRMPVGGAGVNLSVFNPNRFQREQINQLRSSLNLAHNNIVVGYVGRMDRDKGLTELLAAMTQLRDELPCLRLLLVGDRLIGDRNTAINRQLAALGNTVITTGFRTDIPAMLSCMDIVVSASRRDGFGMVLAEAAAMGKPVVATANRGACSAVVHQKTGFLVPVGNTSLLTDKVKTLATNATLRDKMGNAANAEAHKRFGQKAVLDIYSNTYAQLLSEKGLIATAQVKESTFIPPTKI